MKRKIVLVQVLILILFILCSTSPVFAAGNTMILVDGSFLETEVSPTRTQGDGSFVLI